MTTTVLAAYIAVPFALVAIRVVLMNVLKTVKA